MQDGSKKIPDEISDEAGNQTQGISREKTDLFITNRREQSYHRAKREIERSQGGLELQTVGTEKKMF